jgi:hypothetical protein
MIFANRYNKWQPEATDKDAVQDEQQTYSKNSGKKTTDLFFNGLLPIPCNFIQQLQLMKLNSTLKFNSVTSAFLNFYR